MAVAATTAAERIHARRWWTLGTLCLCITVIGIDNTILNVALPSIVRHLRASGSELELMVDGYTIVFACLLLTAGSLGDRYGRRPALILGLAWFGAFSALASVAGTPMQLIVARCLMGVGGAFIYPTTLSILTNTFRQPHERAQAIGVWAGVSGLGVALGPLAGGLLVERFGWGSVFLINVPICAIAIALAVCFVPDTSARGDSPLDPLGALLSIVGLATVLYGVIEGPDRGWGSPRVLVPILGGALFIAAFAAWEAHNPKPMLDVRFFKNPRFSAASATITLTFAASFGATFLMTQYFQFLLGYSPLKAGLMITPVAVGMMLASPFAPGRVNRFGTKRVVMFGLTLIAISTACSGSDTIMSGLASGLLTRLVMGLGFGFTTAPVTESIMGSLPTTRAGIGSAVNDTTRQTGGAIGVALMGTVFAARYRAAIGRLLFVPLASRATARESIGTSLDTASHLRAGDRVALLHAAHGAFLSSMRLTYGVAVVMVLGAVVVAWRFLPARAPAAAHVAPYDSAPASPPDSDILEGLELGIENIVE
ncbi:MAG TPA: MFS transporter [Acidimicrobiales bacterium]|nr:MFS transporter [Acidimicrobiales bacterium]